MFICSCFCKQHPLAVTSTQSEQHLADDGRMDGKMDPRLKDKGCWVETCLRLLQPEGTSSGWGASEHHPTLSSELLRRSGLVASPCHLQASILLSVPLLFRAKTRQEEAASKPSRKHLEEQPDVQPVDMLFSSCVRADKNVR